LEGLSATKRIPYSDESSPPLEAEDSSSGQLVFYDMAYNASKCPGGSAKAQIAEKAKPPKDAKLTIRPQ
jgi:hypothetical protein